MACGFTCGSDGVCSTSGSDGVLFCCRVVLLACGSTCGSDGVCSTCGSDGVCSDGVWFYVCF